MTAMALTALHKGKGVEAGVCKENSTSTSKEIWASPTEELRLDLEVLTVAVRQDGKGRLDATRRVRFLDVRGSVGSAVVRDGSRLPTGRARARPSRGADDVAPPATLPRCVRRGVTDL